MWCVGMTLDDVEKEAIVKAYKFYHGNKTQTAKSLGIAIRTLDAKLDRYGVKKIESIQTGQRCNMESAPHTSSGQRAMPVQERKEVQEVPHEPTSKSHKSKTA